MIKVVIILLLIIIAALLIVGVVDGNRFVVAKQQFDFAEFKEKLPLCYGFRST